MATTQTCICGQIGSDVCHPIGKQMAGDEPTILRGLGVTFVSFGPEGVVDVYELVLEVIPDPVTSFVDAMSRTAARPFPTSGHQRYTPPVTAFPG